MHAFFAQGIESFREILAVCLICHNASYPPSLKRGVTRPEALTIYTAS